MEKADRPPTGYRRMSSARAEGMEQQQAKTGNTQQYRPGKDEKDQGIPARLREPEQTGKECQDSRNYLIGDVLWEKENIVCDDKHTCGFLYRTS